MSSSHHSFVRGKVRAIGKLLLVSAISFLGLGAITPAWAYIGDSFIRIPGQPGQWQGTDYKGWIRLEANQWQGRLGRPTSSPGDFLTGDKFWFGGSIAPKPGGSGKIIVSLSKSNPDHGKLFALCASKVVLPEMDYAESSVQSRPPLENGPRPASVPAYWEFSLKDVEIINCPTLPDAKQQAFTITFKNIEWTNYDPNAPFGTQIEVSDDKIYNILPAEEKPGKMIKSYLVTWFAPATDPGDEACPVLNQKPSEEDIYRYLSAEDAEKLRAKTKGKGITYGLDSENRGPGRLSVSAFPGIIPDPGQIEPQTRIAPGLDLDGNDGTGRLPKGIRKHENFTSRDGRKGIDNQLLRVWGCVTGFRGKRGYNNQTPNARRADGNIVTIIEISEIDDLQNDNEVYVALIHSLDKPIRDSNGQTFIAGYSFRPTYDKNFAYFNMRVRGRIRDGVITTDTMPEFDYNPGQGPNSIIYQAKMRFEPLPDGSVKGYIGGYTDYRNGGYGGYGEGLFNFQAPAVYNSMRRHADGLYDPVSGEYNGLSMAYEIDTVPAFITPAEPGTIARRDDKDGKSSR